MSENNEPSTPEALAAQNVGADTVPPEVASVANAGQSEPDSQSSEATTDPAPAAEGSSATPAVLPTSGGPINLERIRQLRLSQQSTATSKSSKKVPKSAAPNFKAAAGQTRAKLPTGQSSVDATPQSTPVDESNAGQLAPLPTPPPLGTAAKIVVPSRRQPLSKDMEDELSAVLSGADLDQMLVGDASLQVGKMLDEGQRLQGKVMKVHGEHVFVALGGANEGVLPSLQFEELPAEGAQLDVVVRGYLAQEGLYELTMPGNAVSVDDWSDIKEGEVVEAVITASNTGGLECKVGNIRGFIPASQVSEYRVEDFGDFVDQKFLCVVTEANERRGNLVLSRRAVLEREKKEKRTERLAALEIGSAVDGIVRKITDFGAFVDIGGIDGLLHISQLSWERVKHPSEVLEEGQKIQVRVDKIDEQTGKIGLSYRSLQDHPWEDIESKFPVGSLVKGSVTRIAEFGAFVRVATGVEGLIHVSELAHHRVSNVSNIVSEGQEVEVKVLSVDAEQQRISLSLKAATAAPEQPKDDKVDGEVAVEEPRPEPVLPKHQGPLKGGTGRPSGGDQFGLKW
ncbi:MAG: S1 RNA-binding domain-containing protein [Pirellulaceae bacterium]